MKDLKVSLKIDAKTGTVKFELDKLKKALGEVGTQGQKASTQNSKGFQQASQSAKGLNNSVSKLKKSIAGLATIAVGTKLASEFIKAGDAVKSINAKLDLVTDSTQEYNLAQQEVFRIAQETRQALGSTVDLYTRMERALAGQNVAQQQVLQVTETVNQALAVSGATAQEASSVILQLSQGLAAGALRGEEFNSVNESGSRIMQALRDELGKTSGELREMAFEGKLTTEVITEALKNQSAAIGSEFGKLPLTVSGAFQQLSNANTKFLGELDQNLGITDKLAASMGYLAENIDTVYVVLGKVVTVAAIVAGGTGLQAIVKGLGGLTISLNTATVAVGRLGAAMKAVLLANPYTTGLLALYAAYEGVSRYIDEHNTKTKELTGFSKEATTAIESLRQALSGEYNDENIKQYTRSLSVLKSELQQVREEIKENQRRQQQGFDVNYDTRSPFAMLGSEGGAAEAYNKRKEAELEIMIKVAKARQLLNTIIGEGTKLYDAASKKVEQQIQAENELAEAGQQAVQQFIETTDKQIAKQAERNEQIGKTREEIILLNAEKMKALTTDEKEIKLIDKKAKELVRLIKIEDKKLKQDKAEKEAEKELGEYKEKAVEIIREYGTEQEKFNLLKEEEIKLIAMFKKHGLLSKELLAAMGRRTKEMGERIKESNKAKEKSIDLFADLLRGYDDEINALGSGKQQRMEYIAAQELEQQGIEVTKEKIDQLVERYKQLEQAQQAAAYQSGISGAFGNLLKGDFKGFLLGLDGVLDQASNNISGAIVDGFSQGFAKGGGLSGGLSGAFKGGASVAAAVPVIGWIYAGMKINEGLYKKGWGGDDAEIDQGTAALTTAASGLGATVSLFSTTAYKLIRKLGISERWASLLSGQAIIARLFGRKRPEITQQGYRIATGGSGYEGYSYADMYRKGGLFRSSSRYTETGELTEDVSSAFDEIVEVIKKQMQALGKAFGTEAGGIVDAAFEQVYDKEGKLVDSFSTFFGRVYKESAEQFAARLASESTIAYLDTLIDKIVGSLDTPGDDLGSGDQGGGGRDDGRDWLEPTAPLAQKQQELIGQVTLAAEAYRGSSEELQKFTTAAVSMVSAMVDGKAIFDTFAENLTITEELVKAGENLNQAWTRLLMQNELFNQSFETMGINLEMGAGEFTRFVDGIIEAAGDLQKAAELFESYFNNFYSPQELLETNINSASELLGQQASNLGIDPNITKEQFRQEFEAKLAAGELTEKQIAQYLEFAQTLARVNELQEQRNAALAKEAEAMLKYLEFGQGLQQQINELNGNGLSDFQKELQSIEEQRLSNIETLHELARSAGMAAASEEDLARANELASLRTQAAIRALRAEAENLVSQLYGDNAQAAVNNHAANQQSAISSTAQAGNNMFKQWESAIGRIKDYTNSLLVDSRLSPLEADDLLAEAEQQYYDAVNAANAGDVEAAQQVPNLLRQYLTILRDVRASGEDYNVDYYRALEAANAITAPEQSEGGVQVSPSPTQIAYDNQRYQQNAEQMAHHRLELATALAKHVADLSRAINEPVLQLLSDMGVDVSEFLKDLGINMEDATGETVAQLAALAQTFGIEVTELADNVGVSLGSLADAQSLLNDGLEATIDGLPSGIQSQLTPLLRAVENAADGTAQEQALAELEAVTSRLPAQYRNLLAPYFSNIDPTSALTQQLYELGVQTDYLAQIARNTASSTSTASVPSYDVGTPFVPNDQLAMVHKGEMIIPRKYANVIRSGSGGGQSVAAAINRLSEQIRNDSNRNRQLLDNIAENAKQIDNNTGQMSDEFSARNNNNSIRRGRTKCG